MKVFFPYTYIYSKSQILILRLYTDGLLLYYLYTLHAGKKKVKRKFSGKKKERLSRVYISVHCVHMCFPFFSFFFYLNVLNFLFYIYIIDRRMCAYRYYIYIVCIEKKK